MARPGISYEDVRKAAANLLEQGLNPSIQRIREHLGTGSNSTIAEHLKQWQQELTAAPQTALLPAVPAAVLTALEAFWQIAVEHADNLYQERREQATQTVATAEQARAEAILAMNQAHQEASALQQRLESLQATVRELENSLLIEKERRNVAETAIIAAEQRASEAVLATEQVRQETQARITRLEDRLRQTREDTEQRLAEAEQQLNHERERGEANETRLLRIMDQNRTEQAAERQTFSTTLKASQQREARWQEQLEALRKEHTVTCSTLAGTTERNRLLETELERLRDAQQEQENRYLAALRQTESLQTELKTLNRERQGLQQELNTYRQKLQAGKTQNAAEQPSPPSPAP
jgi:chromosome segregation ATPase